MLAPIWSFTVFLVCLQPLDIACHKIRTIYIQQMRTSRAYTQSHSHRLLTSCAVSIWFMHNSIFVQLSTVETRMRPAQQIHSTPPVPVSVHANWWNMNYITRINFGEQAKVENAYASHALLAQSEFYIVHTHTHTKFPDHCQCNRKDARNETILHNATYTDTQQTLWFRRGIRAETALE